MVVVTVSITCTKKAAVHCGCLDRCFYVDFIYVLREVAGIWGIHIP